MEVVVQTEYQDIYRITDGVLLVINKFKYMFPDKSFPIWTKGKRAKNYNKNTKWLTIQQGDYEDDYSQFPEVVKDGTVLYYNRPVVSTDNKSIWTYQIKTTGECFSGNNKEMEHMLSEIMNIIGN